MADSSADIEKFVKSFHALGKALKQEDIQIKLNPDTTEWSEFLDKVETNIKDFAETEKTKKRLESLLQAVKVASRKVTQTISSNKKSLIDTIYKRPESDFNPIKEEIAYTLGAVNKMEGILFERARVTPARIPECESHLQQVQAVKGLLAQLNVEHVEDLDKINFDSVDPAVIKALLHEANKLDKTISSVIKTDRVQRDALDLIYNPRNVLSRLKPLRSAFQDVQGQFSNIQASGQGISGLVGTLVGFASQVMYDIAAETERRRILSEGTTVDLESGKTQALKVQSLLGKILNGIVANYDKLEKSLKLLGKSTSTTLFLFELLMQGLTYTAEANKSVVELFGGNELLYDIEPNSDNLFQRIDEMNKALNSFQDRFMLDAEERRQGIQAFRQAGGSTKALDIDGSKPLGDPRNIRNIFSPINLAAEYGHLLGQSFTEVMSQIGHLTSASRLSMVQVEQVFEAARVGATVSRTQTSVSLNALIEISERFGGVVNTFTVNSSLLSRIAQKTGLNEKQAAEFVSSMLENIKSQRFDDMGRLITLADYDLDNKASIDKLRERLRENYKQVRISLNASLIEIARRSGTASQDYLLVKSQLASLDFYEKQLNNPEILLSLLEASKVFPQAVLPIVQDAIDNQIRLIYGTQADRVFENSLSYRAALELASKQLNIPEQYRDLLIAEKFDANGVRRRNNVNIAPLEASLPTPPDPKKQLTAVAEAMARKTTNSSKVLQKAKEALFANLGSVFRRAFSVIQKAVEWFNQVTTGIKEGRTAVTVGALGGGLAAGGLTVFGLVTAGFGGGILAAAGLTMLGVGGVAGGQAGLAVDKQFRLSKSPLGSAGQFESTLTIKQEDSEVVASQKVFNNIASDAQLYGPVIQVANEYGVHPALIFALKAQATGDLRSVPNSANARPEALGVFQLIPKYWNATKEQCTDLVASARLVSERTAENIQKVMQIAKERNLSLGTGDILALAGAMNTMPDLVEDVLRNKANTYRIGSDARTNRPNLPTGASADEVNSQINLAMHRVLGIPMDRKTPYEGLRDNLAVAMGTAAFTPTGSGLPRAIDSITNAASRGKISQPVRPDNARVSTSFPEQSVGNYRVPTQKSRPTIPRILAPKFDSSTGSLTKVTSQKDTIPSAPKFTIEQIPDTLGERRFRYIVASDSELAQYRNQVFYKNVLYETLYLNDANNLIRVWQRLVGNSGP